MKDWLTGTAVAVVVAGIASQAAAVEWNASLWGSRRAFTEHVEKLAEIVNEKSGGDFTINISYGGLSKNTENLDGISIGAFEMAQFCAGYHRDKNPTITVLELPFLGVKTLEEEVAVSNAVYSHPAVVDDLARWNAKLLMPTPMPQYNIVGTGEPLDKLEQFKGMRVRATGGIGEAFRTVGAVPTSVTATEAYQAMESGVVDTVSFAQHAHLSFRTIDEADWWTENLNPGTLNCPVVVNTDAYATLSDEHRQILDDSVSEAIDFYLENYGKLLDRWEEVLAEKEVQKVTISDEELAEFRRIGGEPIQLSWIEDMSAVGLPARELYELVQQTLEETRAK
ncbi:TRAP-type C4-dicarboxylate transport system, substrate-binding protein [Poseidonocella pacifica]|uniref:TRAP-type C4-dicarboxylate transport system, substrate-binding protein n=1 Tax=Poseidonocella pacifica TaxID=871651 RepID=A0A1I0VTN8_9RHOB|nr:C4-dicarboxylate TRAP transporter substrate-binding protein [Poseidonocella pacifica]SFA79769.1 TRAP-type C4-dicarboxylate transport system, substrate-binding protein [Poseidonocella pacifica]